ncbi:MAG: group 1 truncated hemoglobin [Burkholderiales bacterium]|nr:group 1 truncated hemoglobin [Burkholderiales bacterium]
MQRIVKTRLKQFACAVIFASTCLATQAQSQAAGDSLYQSLGQKEGIDKIVADFIPLIQADSRIARFFEKLDKPHFAGLLSAQLCQVAGGPCKYEGKDMYIAHDEMGVSLAHFNALAEDLQIAMEKNNISSSASNQLVAKLAPLQRAIVKK